jgi:hypothetical protein
MLEIFLIQSFLQVQGLHMHFAFIVANCKFGQCIFVVGSYSLWFGKRRRFGQDLSQTLGI